MGELVLPTALGGGAFTVREARAAEMRDTDLRVASLHVPTRGVRSLSATDELVARAHAFARALPEDVAFSHVTAARLLRLPLPRALETDDTLDVMRSSSHARIRRAGCHGHRGLERREVLDLGGLRVVALADTWCDLAEVSGRGIGVDDLVVVGDVVANRLQGHRDLAGLGVSVDDVVAGEGVVPGGPAALRAALHARVRPRGRATLDVSVDLVRVGSRSPMETRARLMFHRAGFPEPALNADVRDAHGGWLLEGDLVWHRYRVIGEYQGADHASIKRRSADGSRSGRAEDHDYRVIEIFAEDVFGGARRRTLLRRFARAMALDPADLRIE